MAHPTLHGERVTLRELLPTDRDRLRAILAEPEVARWWGTRGPDAEVDELLGPGGHVPLAIEVDGELVGSIQYAGEDEPDYRHAGIDIFLATARHGARVRARPGRDVARRPPDGRARR